MPKRLYYVYILASTSRILYTGITNSIQRRTYEHREKMVPGFTSRYNVTQLMYYEVFSDPRLAIGREKQIKAWRREKRVAFIESKNPGWRDLSEEWMPMKSKRDSSSPRCGLCRNDGN
jgi:putative endonuclease